MRITNDGDVYNWIKIKLIILMPSVFLEKRKQIAKCLISISDRIIRNLIKNSLSRLK